MSFFIQKYSASLVRIESCEKAFMPPAQQSAADKGFKTPVLKKGFNFNMLILTR